MLEFRKVPKRTSTQKGSVDGFHAQQGSLAGTSAASERRDLDNFQESTTSKASTSVGFEQQFTQALENRGSLPVSTLNPYAPSHTKQPKKGRGKLRKTLKGLGVGLGLVSASALLIAVFVFGKAWLTALKIFQGGGSSAVLFDQDVKPEQLKGEGDGRVNVLLAGIGGGGRAGENLTDSIVIASIDPIAKDVTLLSIPRDMWVDVPNFWSMKINAAYSSAKDQALENGSTEQEAIDAGFRTMEETISQHFGIPIHYHALVNFQGFRQGIDAIGGVDVQVEEDLYDYVIAPDNNGNPLIAAQGLQQFDGKTALLYAQSRSSSNDFERGQRQRQLIIALKSKVLQVGTFSNPTTVTKLIDALGENVSINATLGEIMRMYEIIKDTPDSQIVSLGFTDEPNVLVKTSNINDQSVVIPRLGSDDYSEIRDFVRNSLRDPFLKKENASIAVLNGTSTSGLATKKADELKSYGYNVTVIDDAPTKDYTQTVLYDRSAGVQKYTRNYLEKRLGISVSEEPQTTTPITFTADFVIVVGENEISETTD
jgi:LCP family protein required for cell wall assembly